MDNSPLEMACAAIAHGHVVGVPTDTVYGLAIDPRRKDSFEALYAVKRRAPDKAIPILVSDADQAAGIVEVSELGRHLMSTHWPGGLTIVLKRRRDVPVHLGDPVAGTVAVRAPNNQVALDLLRMCGPLAVSSANRSDDEPAIDAQSAREVFGVEVAVYLEGSEPIGTPSTVVDATGSEPLVLRTGAVDLGSS